MPSNHKVMNIDFSNRYMLSKHYSKEKKKKLILHKNDFPEVDKVFFLRKRWLCSLTAHSGDITLLVISDWPSFAKK